MNTCNAKYKVKVIIYYLNNRYKHVIFDLFIFYTLMCIYIYIYIYIYVYISGGAVIGINVLR